METIEVYKIVRLHANGPLSSQQFHSYAAQGMLAKKYDIGRTIHSETPLFVFTDIKNAKSFLDENVRLYTILRGTTTDAPISLPQLACLLPVHVEGYTYRDIKHFWTLFREFGVKEVQEEYDLLIAPPPGTYIVYNFTPQAIVE